MNKTKFQAGFQSRYGDAGPPVQYYTDDVYKITKGELRERIKELNVKPEDLYTKEEILSDSEVKDYIELERQKAEKKIEADKLKEEDMLIPGSPNAPLTDEQKRQQEKDNELIADGKSDSDDDDDLIP